MKRGRARGEDALARRASPELHDFEFLFACAAPDEIAAAADGKVSGTLVAWGTRAMRGMADI
jgi:hypothetical protein